MGRSDCSRRLVTKSTTTCRRRTFRFSSSISASVGIRIASSGRAELFRAWPALRSKQPFLLHNPAIITWRGKKLEESPRLVALSVVGEFEVEAALCRHVARSTRRYQARTDLLPNRELHVHAIVQTSTSRGPWQIGRASCRERVEI